MFEVIAGILGFIVIVAGIGLGLWALRHQSRQFPKDKRIPTDEEESKSEARSSAWMQLGGRG